MSNPADDLLEAQERLRVANEYRQTWDKETAFSYAENAAEYAMKACQRLTEELRTTREALERYADDDNWSDETITGSTTLPPHRPTYRAVKACKLGPEPARAALERK